MSTNKAALKAAKAALDAKNYDEAIVQAQIVLSSDARNYFAKLFLGRASDKQGKPDDAERAYLDATQIKPTDDQAWQGLRSLYESQGGKKVDGYITAAIRLAEIYAEVNDKHRCQTTVDKLISVAKANGSIAQYKRALEVQLPTSSIFSFLEGRIPHPSHTYTRLIEITEKEEKEKINKSIGERRTRLGARIGQVTNEVKLEVYGKSNLEDLYQNVIDWTNDDEARRQCEEKLLQRAYDTLVVLPNAKKANKREQVQKLAKGMVIIKHPFDLAWELELEWRDADSLAEWDEAVISDFITLFPEKGLVKVLEGIRNSDLAPWPAKPVEHDTNDDENEQTALSPEDRLLLMTEGLEDAKQSVLAHRLVSEYYLLLEEFESAVDTARSALKLQAAEVQRSGLKFYKSFNALQSALATALIHYQTPRNHPEAKSLFENILKHRATFTPALIGIGLILEEEKDYSEAINFLSKAVKRDPNNVRVSAETAWCRALDGELERGLNELQASLEKVDLKDPRTRDLRALILYRIGRCQWDLDPTRAARKDRNGAYSKFLSAIKTNINFAPAYTSLGFYYADYARDRKRARQCFQKAFELSASEVDAAERLARSYADQGDWDIVEVIAQRVIDSGQAKPAPGSKRKGISWPFSAMGIVQMNKQDYQKSIISFLAALRISPEDYHAYIGLGESYHNSGRYNSAARTFTYAEQPTDGVQMKGSSDNWFTKYMLANVNRELGSFDEAIEDYQLVLEARPKEYGVSIALLQTLVEKAWRSIERGFFGAAVDSSRQAIDVAEGIIGYMPDAFNLWKAVGDACSVFSWVQSRLDQVPFQQTAALLTNGSDSSSYDVLADVDGVGHDQVSGLDKLEQGPEQKLLKNCLFAAILAYKRAIASCSDDIHAQAVAWYNLGWMEYRAHVCLEWSGYSSDGTKAKHTKHIHASMRCFKRAIELEAGNAEFWNSLGVVTTRLNPKVAQHSFVRSLHLNERNAHVWTNLGTLYLLQNDVELAHRAFERAQSTDPDYAHAWLGEGLVALLCQEGKEALLHFVHAFDISGSSSSIAKREFASSTFNHLLSNPLASNDPVHLIKPIFGLRQLLAQHPVEGAYSHLLSLYLGRLADHDSASETLDALCASLEAEYETSESTTTLAQFAQAKADFARNKLATQDYDAAIEHAETALDLAENEEDGGKKSESPPINHDTVRLSAHLTSGLAHYYSRNADASIEAFRTALTESNANPDIVCLLARVLWAKGGAEERAVAKEQLATCVERHADHVGALLLRGVMAVLEADDAVGSSVLKSLQRLRMAGKLTDASELRDAEKVLDALAGMLARSHSAGGESADGEAEVCRQNQMEADIMLAPYLPHAWAQLAECAEVGEEPASRFPAEMALLAALRGVPLRGELAPDELARAFAGTGKAGDAQCGIMIAPWVKEGWGLLGALQ